MDAVRRALRIGVWLLVATGAPLVSADQRSGSLVRSEPVETVLPGRLERLEQWLKALDRHTPGEDDDALAVAASWSNSDLRGLWVDANALTQMMRNRSLDRM